MQKRFPVTAYPGLTLWSQVVRQTVRSAGPDLTARQLALLLRVFLCEPPHTVRGLASELGVTKPVVTRALDTLCGLGFLRRKRDEADKRNVLVVPTMAGARFLSAFNDEIVKALPERRSAAFG